MPSANSAGGTLYLVLIQVASRALTFAGNQFLLRFLSPELLGIAVQLELLSVSILYFSRESLRVALQKQPKVVQEPSKGESATQEAARFSSQVIVNLSYVAVGIGLPLTLGLSQWYWRSASTEVVESPQFSISLLLYGLATAVELLAEPSFVVIQKGQLYKARARSETTAAIFKCISACLAASLMHQRRLRASVLPFAIGQLVYAVTLLALYLQTTYPLSRTQNFSLTIRHLNATKIATPASDYILNRFFRPLLFLSVTIYGQSLLKQILTQGDAVLLSLLAPLSDQGAFALASNYGGLLARLVFQPIEESSRNTFGALLSSSSSSSSSTATTNDQTQSNVTVALRNLASTLHLYALLTVSSISLAPHLLPALVSILAGQRFYTPQIAALLSAYAYYIPFLAYNGILDAFVTAVATPAQLRTQSVAMAGCTGVYAVALWVCLGALGMGARGLVVANAVGMGVRIVWSVWFVNGWVGEGLKDRDLVKRKRKTLWRNAMPSAGSVATAVLVAAFLKMGVEGEKMGRQIGAVGVIELAKMIGAAVFLGVALLIFEREYLIQAISEILPERLAQKLKIPPPRPSPSQGLANTS